MARKKKGVKFNPDRAFVRVAVFDFLSRGGIIKKLVFARSEQTGTDWKAIDEWLCDSGRAIVRDYPEGFFG